MANWAEDRSAARSLDYYAGIADPANGSTFALDFTTTLRWWALFFDRIIIPDKCFCVYGPLYHYLTHIDLQAQSVETNDPLLLLLEAGVITPGITTDASTPDISGAWSPANGSDDYLNLTRKDGDNYLKQLNRFTTTCARQPKKAINEKSGKSLQPSFPDLVAHFISAPDMFLDELLHGMAPTIPGMTAESKGSMERVCTNIREAVTEHGQDLRRRHLEDGVFRSISQEFGIRFRDIYDLGLRKTLGRNNPPLSIRIRHVLAGIATLSQMLDSLRWNAIGGLLKDHVQPLVLAVHGVSPEQFTPPALSGVATWATGKCDLSKVPFEKVLSFRESPIFDAYKKEAVKVEMSAQGLCQRNPDFINFLTHEYMPAIQSMARETTRNDHAQTAKKIVDSLTPPAAVAGVAGVLLNRLFHSWDVAGFGTYLTFGGMALAWIGAARIGVPIGRMVESKARVLLTMGRKNSITSNYVWH
jgi:hypothetical protein